MDDLIEALTILRKYANPKSPTQCSHDTLWVAVDPALVSEEDTELLDQLGFFVGEEDDVGFMSYRFGSC